ncbi:MAG: IS1 family transposase, partial [Bacteroidales bacterium]
GRLLHISKSSVQRMMLKIAGKMEPKQYEEENESYEIDELRTFCGNKKKECWLIYAINRKSRQVIDFFVGRRTKENVNRVVSSVLQLKPQCIYSDGLNLYKSLIPVSLHKIYEHCTNHIERCNLTLRTHLKRLGRKSLCYSKSEKMLWSCTRIYFG